MKMIQSFLGIIALCSFVQAATPSSTLTRLGSEALPIDAMRTGMGGAGSAYNGGASVSLLNPARMAFQRKTIFSGSVLWRETKEDLNALSSASSNFRIPQIGFSFPAGFVGNIGLIYWQRFYKNQNILQGNAKYPDYRLQWTSSLYEVVPTWAHTITRSWSIGAAWHMILGNELMKQEYTLSDLSGTDLDVNAYLGVSRFKDEISIRNSSGSYPSLSTHYHQKKWDIALSWSAGSKVTRNVDRKIELEFRDSTGRLAQSSYGLDSILFSSQTLKQEFPASIGGAFSFQFLPRQILAIDWFQDLESDWQIQSLGEYGSSRVLNAQGQKRLSLGWSYLGSGNRFDSFFRRTNYQAGISWRKLYMGDVNEYSGSTGFGLFLGRRGSLLNLSLFGGLRQGNVSNSEISETFLGLKASFTGLGVWGKTSRAYR